VVSRRPTDGLPARPRLETDTVRSGTLEISQMSEPPAETHTLIVDLEHRQEDVIRQLDDLNRRIEQAVSQCRVRVETAQAETRRGSEN
jgi:hypothetical protein